MKSFKVLFVPLLSFSLIFSSSPALARNLVSTIPDFYYLEDLNDDSISVRSCLRSETSTTGLNCTVVAMVFKSDLNSFDLLGTASIVGGSGLSIYGLGGILFPDIVGGKDVKRGFSLRGRRELGAIQFAWGLVFITLGFFFYSSSKLSKAIESLGGSEQLNSGIIFGEGNLKQFTNFLNIYGIRPDNGL